MKRYKLFPVLRHAVMMVGRTLKSYALLSVTIVLSFSLLLGYLVYTDSAIYNENKEVFRYRRGDIVLSVNEADQEELRLFLDNLDAMPGTGYFISYHYVIGQLSTKYAFDGMPEKKAERLFVYADLMPDHAWPEGTYDLYNDRQLRIVWLDGQDHSDFVLEEDQVILSEAVYRALGMDQQENPVFHMSIRDGQRIPLEVVGYRTEQTYEEWVAYGEVYGYDMRITLSTKFAQYAQLENEQYWSDRNYPSFDTSLVRIYSETPEKVVKLLETMGYTYYWAAYAQQDAVLGGIRQEKENKAIITCALLLLLGINLYSSFTNALNDRKFEIGVKRAMGASAFSIVRQFLYESMLVMCANTILSVGLVADVAIIYKYVVEHSYDELGNPGDFILYVSPYSIGMFATCAVTLTVVFSLIFAYKSTRVEIVQYLKSE